MPTFYEKGKKYNCVINGKPYYRKKIVINGVSKQVYGDGEKDANRKIDELKALANAGMDLRKQSAKLGETFKYWLFKVKRVDKNIKASSFSRYECAYRKHIEPYPICSIYLKDMDPVMLQDYFTSLYEDHGVSGASIKETMKVWKMFSSWAVDNGYMTKNFCKGITLPGKREKGKKVIEVFTEEERRKLLDYMLETDYQYDTLIRLAFATGMRQGELLGLRWEDVDEHAIHVRQSTAVVTHVNSKGERTRSREIWDTKTENAVRDIPILPSVAAMIESHRRAQEEFFTKRRKPVPAYVFTTDTGELIDQTNLAKSYRRLLTRAEIPYRKFHAIRHTFATEAIRRGVDVKDLQLLMGHADLQTTYVYVQSNDESKRAAIDKMGELM